ncbi:MAG: T9SS type A sorting domain-containing protein [Polaribacter sp.]
MKTNLLREKVLIALLILATSFSTLGQTVITSDASGDWVSSTTWVGGVVPTSADNVIINNGHTVDIGATASAEVASVIANGTLRVLSNNNNSGSLVFTGTITGEITYRRRISNIDYKIISSPTNTQNIKDFAEDSGNKIVSVTTGGTTKYAIGIYNNEAPAGSRWEYYSNPGSTGNPDIRFAGSFVSGHGYTMKRLSSGRYTFKGDVPSTNVSVNITTASGSHYWGALGNPYLAFLPANNNSNATSNLFSDNMAILSPNFQALYFWDGTQYVAVNNATAAYELAPGQGFVAKVKSNNELFVFNKTSQTGQGAGYTFYRSISTTPEIIVNLSNGTESRKTTIKYFADSTKGLDAGYDAGAYEDGVASFSIDTHLVNDSEGIDFTLQCLPDNNYENIIVPLAVTAANGETLTFSAAVANLPSDINVYIEDLETNTITKINDGSYEVNLNSDINGIGRFYMHTTNSNVLTTNEFILQDVNLYKTSTDHLRITGLQDQGTAKLTLYTITGREVFTHSFNAQRVHDVTVPSNLKTGFYLAQIVADNRKFVKKIIIE